MILQQRFFGSRNRWEKVDCTWWNTVTRNALLTLQTNNQLDLKNRGRSEIVTDFVRLATCIPDASTTVVVKQ